MRILPFLFSTPALAAEEASGRVPGTEMIGWSGLVQVGAGLLSVMALIGLLAWGLRRLNRVQAGAGGLRVVGGLSLGARERVVLVQVGERQLLLGVAPGRVQTLHVLEEPLQAAPAGPDFSASLKAVLGGGRR